MVTEFSRYRYFLTFRKKCFLINALKFIIICEKDHNLGLRIHNIGLGEHKFGLDFLEKGLLNIT